LNEIETKNRRGRRREEEKKESEIVESVIFAQELENN